MGRAAARRAATVAQIHSRRALMRLVGKPHIRPQRLVQPDAIRRSYFRRLLRVLERARKLFTDRVEPTARLRLARHAKAVKVDAAFGEEQDFADLFDEIKGDLFDEFTNYDLSAVASATAHQVDQNQRIQFQRQMRAVLGVDVIKAEPWLASREAAFVAENVSLIKSVPSDYFDDLEKTITRGMRGGLRWEELADDIEHRYDVAESHAKLIARDQVGKYFGELNAARQQDIGVEEFVWRTVHDNRVRESHADLDGETFRWDDPPDVDGEPSIPGQPINCRCGAEPVLDQLVEESNAESVTGLDSALEDYSPEEPRDYHGRWVGANAEGIIVSSILKRGAMDVPRATMPQIRSKDWHKFKQFLHAHGITTEKTKLPVDSLKPTQHEIIAAKLREMASRSAEDLAEKRILVSSDGYILDGHHHWAAQRALDPHGMVRVRILGAPISQLLKIAREFPQTFYKTHGDNYDPAEPRDWHGRWSAEGQAETYAAAERAAMQWVPHGTTGSEARELREHALREGGFTYDVASHSYMTKGYAVAVHPEAEVVMKGKPDPSDIERYVGAHATQLKDSEAKIGAWYDKQGDRWFFDVVHVVADKDRAHALANRNGHHEIAIFDLSTHTEIPAERRKAPR